jgi:hypothetical protein
LIFFPEQRQLASDGSNRLASDCWVGSTIVRSHANLDIVGQGNNPWYTLSGALRGISLEMVSDEAG